MLYCDFFPVGPLFCRELESDYPFPLTLCEVNVTNSNPDSLTYRITVTLVPSHGRELVFFEDDLFSFSPPTAIIINFDRRIFLGVPFIITIHYPYNYGIKVVGWVDGPYGITQRWSRLLYRLSENFYFLIEFTRDDPPEISCKDLARIAYIREYLQ